MIKRIKNIFSKHDFIIVFVLSSLVGLGLYLYRETREFGINFITELASVWVTVFLVNRLIEKRERKKRVSIDQRILKETLSIVASYFSIWKHLVWKYFPEAKINSEHDLITIYPEILKTAQLSTSFEIVSIHDPESWKLFFHNRTIKECFGNYYETLGGDIKSLIDNFKIHLEPQLLGNLLEINESKYLREVDSFSQNDEMDVIHEFGMDTDRLGSYISSDVGHFKKIFELCLYCGTLRDRILQFTNLNQELYSLKDYFKNPMITYTVNKKPL